MSGALVLVGLSGSGKSTIGALTAALLDLRFVDTDRLVEISTGLPVAGIFRDRGEAAFRALERQALAEACATPAVVATGGGAILLAENRETMRRRNFVVWLDPPLPLLAARLQQHVQGEERPLLAGGLERRLRELYDARRDLYAATAHYHVPHARCAASDAHQLAGELVDAYRRWMTGTSTPESEGTHEAGIHTGF